MKLKESLKALGWSDELIASFESARSPEPPDEWADGEGMMSFDSMPIGGASVRIEAAPVGSSTVSISSESRPNR